MLSKKAIALKEEKEKIDVRLSIINHILEDEEMKYQVAVKEIPEAIVYYSEVRLPRYSDMMQYIPKVGQECMKLNSKPQNEDIKEYEAAETVSTMMITGIL